MPSVPIPPPLSTPFKDRVHDYDRGEGAQKKTIDASYDTVAEDLASKLQPLSWGDFASVVFDQGDHDPSREHIVFPRPPLSRDRSIVYETLPRKHRHLVERIKSSPTWEKGRQEFSAMKKEVDYYAPLRRLLTHITSETAASPHFKEACDTCAGKWVISHRHKLGVARPIEGPEVMPDLLFAHGWHPQRWFGQNDYTTTPDQSSSVLANDALVVFEVKHWPGSNPENVFQTEASGSSTEAPLSAADTALTRVAIDPFGDVQESTGGNMRSSSTSNSQSGPGANKRPRTTTLSGPTTSKARRPAATSTATLLFPYNPKIGAAFRRIAASDFATPNEVLQQLIIYISAIRERQTLRTGGIGILLQNTQATFVYSDPCSTICTYPIDIFNDSEIFISMIIFISQMDYIAAGYDPLWVTTKRLDRTDPKWDVADPRLEKNRMILFMGILLIIEALILRRYTVHGRGTTILATYEWQDPAKNDGNDTGKRGVLKLSFPVNGRVTEAELWAKARECGVDAMVVPVGYIQPIGIWDHPILKLHPPKELREARALYLPRFTDFSSIEDPQILIVRMLEVMQSKHLVSPLLNVRLIDSSHLSVAGSLEEGRNITSRHIIWKHHGYYRRPTPRRCHRSGHCRLCQ